MSIPGVLIPCGVCGDPSEKPRCHAHARTRARDISRGTARSRGYDTHFDRISRRARALQPFCSDCGSRERLSADHSPRAWWRKLNGLAVRLEDISVVCSPCNSRRGESRPGSDRWDLWAATNPPELEQQ